VTAYLILLYSAPFRRLLNSSPLQTLRNSFSIFARVLFFFFQACSAFAKPHKARHGLGSFSSARHKQILQCEVTRFERSVGPATQCPDAVYGVRVRHREFCHAERLARRVPNSRFFRSSRLCTLKLECANLNAAHRIDDASKLSDQLSIVPRSESGRRAAFD